MRRPLFVANWKMHKSVRDAVAFVDALASSLFEFPTIDVAVAPPFTALKSVADAARGTKVAVAAQNLWFETQGAFTGEISGGMIKDAGATMVIVGHSERRRMFGDTDESVNRKARAALAEGLTPIVCVGETLEEREHGHTLGVLDRQIGRALEGILPADVARLVIAYEPVWAIGTGKNATPVEAREAHAHIRSRLLHGFGETAAADCRILYGGSVKPDNTHDLVGLDDVDGALVGGASLTIESFWGILKAS